MLRAIFLILIVCSAAVQAESLTPKIWGYGTKSCTAYAKAYKDKETGDQTKVWEYFRYRDWLTGFVSGLTMATGVDVMQSVDPQNAMRRINLICEDDLGKDFFTATMEFIRIIGTNRMPENIEENDGSMGLE